MIYPKYDAILKRDLHARERVEPCKTRLAWSKKFLEQSIERLKNVSDDVTEEQLAEIAKLVDEVYNASIKLATHDIIF